MLQDPDINKGSPVVPTGGSKYNAKIDATEYKMRRIGPGLEALKIANVYEREILLIRVGRLPHHDPQVDLPCAHVFGSFNGLNLKNERESQFRFAGLACNSPEHMNRHGPLNAQLAVYADGGNSIFCRSKVPISPGAYIKWKIPSGAGVPQDDKNLGRLLPELVAHTPEDTQLTSLTVHQSVHRSIVGKEHNPEDVDQAYIAVEAWRKITAIAYLAHLAYIEATTGRVPNDAEKINAAIVFGVIKKETTTNNQIVLQQSAMRKLMLDKVFQMNYNAAGNKSSIDENQRPFKLLPIHSGSQSATQSAIARECADPFGGLTQIYLKQLEEDMRNVIGMTTSGGFPGQNMDVILRRI